MKERETYRGNIYVETCCQFLNKLNKSFSTLGNRYRPHKNNLTMIYLNNYYKLYYYYKFYRKICYLIFYNLRKF